MNYLIQPNSLMQESYFESAPDLLTMIPYGVTARGPVTFPEMLWQYFQSFSQSLSTVLPKGTVLVVAHPIKRTAIMINLFMTQLYALCARFQGNFTEVCNG